MLMTSWSAQRMKFSGSRPFLSSARVDTKQSTGSVCALSIAEYEGTYYIVHSMFQEETG